MDDYDFCELNELACADKKSLAISFRALDLWSLATIGTQEIRINKQ